MKNLHLRHTPFFVFDKTLTDEQRKEGHTDIRTDDAQHSIRKILSAQVSESLQCETDPIQRKVQCFPITILLLDS